jgi:hypothetical protein
VGRLLDERRGIRPLGACDVAEVLDRMHERDATPGPPAPSAGTTMPAPNRSATEPECSSTAARGCPDPSGHSLRSLAVADTTSDSTSTAPKPAAIVGESLPTDLVLTPLVRGALGQDRPVMEWLTTFHLASVVLDPYTNESSWILRSATRILEQFRGSDARINFIVTAGANDARAFLGPLADRFLVFCDPDRTAVKAIGLRELPAFVFIRVDGVVAAAAEGWDPEAWESVADAIAEVTWWTSIEVPGPGDPGPFRGSPALG